LLLYTSSSYTRGRANYALYSSTKAALVNLTQALADEWSELGVRVNCVNPERTATPMRTRAFGEEPEHTLLAAETVARASLDVLLSSLTGQVIDVRRSPGESVTVPADAVPGPVGHQRVPPMASPAAHGNGPQHAW
jgi:2-C-methyl-D-erythritol 4-phosphate cytidylyltransferase